MTTRKQHKVITYRGGSVIVLLYQEGASFAAELWSQGVLVTHYGPFDDAILAERAWYRLTREATRMVANGQ